MALDERGAGCGQVIIGAAVPGGFLMLVPDRDGQGPLLIGNSIYDAKTGRWGLGTQTPRGEIDLRGNIYVGAGTGLLRTDSGRLVNVKPAAAINAPVLTVTGTADTTYSSNEVTMLNALKTDVTNLRNAFNALLTELKK